MIIQLSRCQKSLTKNKAGIKPIYTWKRNSDLIPNPWPWSPRQGLFSQLWHVRSGYRLGFTMVPPGTDSLLPLWFFHFSSPYLTVGQELVTLLIWGLREWFFFPLCFCIGSLNNALALFDSTHGWTTKSKALFLRGQGTGLRLCFLIYCYQ